MSSEALSYVLVTPYTIAKSRTGGVISRLLSRLDLELVAAQMIAPDEEFTREYAANLRDQGRIFKSTGLNLLADYTERNLIPSGGRKHRTLLLLFKGEDPCRKLSDICGALYAENRGVESISGETIRDTYADLIVSPDDPERITYFEPAVLTPRNQKAADENLFLFDRFLEGKENIVVNLKYPDPSKIEQTLVIIKPDNWTYASSKPGTIIDMFSRTGLRIVGIKIHCFSLAQALEFYGPVESTLKRNLAPIFGRRAKELLEKEFNLVLDGAAEEELIGHIGMPCAEHQFQDIIEFMSGRRPADCCPADFDVPGGVKSMILIYEGEGAVRKIRDVLGPTDPLKAPGGTVRREFGSNVMVNTAHASDSPESVAREKRIVKINENTMKGIIRTYLDEKGL